MSDAQQTKGPFRADHVGSFLRPAELMAAREKHEKGEIDAAALEEVENRLITEIVKMQEDAGIQAVTDGDFRRLSWSGDFLGAIGGVVTISSPASRSNAHEQTELGGVVRDWQPPTPTTTAKLTWPNDGIQRKSFNFLKGVTKYTPKGRVGGVVAEPLPPQTRACGITALGSSPDRFAQGALP